MSVVVFDSGIGGLSIYNALREILPDVHYIYAFDNDGFPYGNKPSKLIRSRMIAFLNKIQQKHRIDLAVIACNTATTACLDDLRRHYDFPIVGVVPAIKPAAKRSKTKCIGLLATEATATSPYTAKLIEQFAANSQVAILGLNELAHIAEEKLHGHPVDMAQLTELMMPWLTLSCSPDTIVLGCTHYPFLKEELKQLFPDATFVDSGKAIARRVLTLSKQISLEKKNKDRCHNLAICTGLNNNINQLKPVLEKWELPEVQTISLGSV